MSEHYVDEAKALIRARPGFVVDLVADQLSQLAAARAEAQQAKRERDELMNLQAQYAIDNRLALEAAEAENARLHSLLADATAALEPLTRWLTETEHDGDDPEIAVAVTLADSLLARLRAEASEPGADVGAAVEEA